MCLAWYTECIAPPSRRWSERLREGGQERSVALLLALCAVPEATTVY